MSILLFIPILVLLVILFITEVDTFQKKHYPILHHNAKIRGDKYKIIQYNHERCYYIRFMNFKLFGFIPLWYYVSEYKHEVIGGHWRIDQNVLVPYKFKSKREVKEYIETHKEKLCIK